MHKRSVATTVKDITRRLVADGSTEHAAGVQWFFKEQVRSYGWYTADLRRYARLLHRELCPDRAFMLDVAARLFEGQVLEEKALAVLIVQRSLPAFGSAEFRRFDAWLNQVVSWADHDALAMCVLGPLVRADVRLVRRVFVWARSRNRWRRRAAAVSLIDGIRKGLFAVEASAIASALLDDSDDMVQKGLGWMLREWGKHDAAGVMPVLMRIRSSAPRLVLRTACETLSAAHRTRVLG